MTGRLNWNGLNPTERGTINGSERIQLNVQNNIANNSDSNSTSVTTNKTEVEQTEEDQDRLVKMVNILSEIGVLPSNDGDKGVVDVVYEEV